ncbi:MAG: B-box zinc finger protein [Terracidiphilus sp.]|jgi:TM2 domain-containing membrane protein YozV
MDCVNHSGVSATAYCQSCGKALCAGCVRNATGGQILCEPCWTAWQTFQQPFVAGHPSGPNPSAAAVLGLIPGVGAMYNGQFFKGFIHVVVFAVLISITDHYPIFGLFIAAWILYQSFDAFHTAKALREGQPVPDPFGLNEVGNWLNLGMRVRTMGQPGAGPPPVNPGPPGQGPAGPATGSYQPPYAGPYQPPYQSPYQAPFTPVAGFVDPAAPPPPIPWQRKEPIGAIVLIGLGLLFLVGQMRFVFPLLLIALGVWLIVRRLGDSHGGFK